MRGGMAQSAVRSGSLYRPKAWWHGSVGRAKQSYFATKRRAKSLGFKASPSSRRTKFPGKHSWWHGSVGRAHRSHRWGRWFESNCHHSLPSSGGLFFAFFTFAPVCLGKRPPAKNRPNPCPPTFSGLHSPHTSQQRGNTVRRNNSARILMRNKFSPAPEYVL